MTKNSDKTFKNLIKTDLEISPDEKSVQRMDMAIQNELDRQNVPCHDILTFDEVAAYLRVSADLLKDYLDELPCFELGGKLLFRKEVVVDWIDQREKRYRSELHRVSMKKDQVYTIA